jgi:hypothetical protein
MVVKPSSISALFALLVSATLGSSAVAETQYHTAAGCQKQATDGTLLTKSTGEVYNSSTGSTLIVICPVRQVSTFLPTDDSVITVHDASTAAFVNCNLSCRDDATNESVQEPDWTGAESQTGDFNLTYDADFANYYAAGPCLFVCSLPPKATTESGVLGYRFDSTD